MAIRSSTVHELNLAEHWSRSLNDDLVLGELIRMQGLECCFVPELVMPNREECRLANFSTWVTRQLVQLRLYHSQWSLVAVFGGLTSLLLLAAPLQFLVCVLTANWQAAVVATAGFAGYFVVMASCFRIIEGNVAQAIARGGEKIDTMQRGGVLRCVVIAHAVYGYALLRATLARRLHWRGVEYRVDQPQNVRLLEYRPYSPQLQTASSVPDTTF